MAGNRYKRILLKLSGEALMGARDYGVDTGVVNEIADEIKEVNNLSVEVAIVNRGRNIFRRVTASAKAMDTATADY
ncbi:MAG: UMP kinase, partial [Deltaproteobacteria bacterium]|nr:UMP kinase [Deltaproteobacteria bacterium]